MKVIAFFTDFEAVDRIVNHLKPPFVASKPPPPRIVYREVLLAVASLTSFSL
jgi:hypothetical protein